MDSCPKIFFKIFALIMVLFFFSIFFIIITSVLFYGEVIILSICCIPMLPYVVYDYFVYSESHEKCKKNTYKVILVVLYPLWTAIGAVSYVLAMLLYPCLRNPTSHGLYDFFYDIYDLTLSFFAKLYMKYVHRLIDCMLWLVYYLLLSYLFSTIDKNSIKVKKKRNLSKKNRSYCTNTYMWVSIWCLKTRRRPQSVAKGIGVEKCKWVEPYFIMSLNLVERRLITKYILQQHL